MLEHHADFPPHFIDPVFISGQLNPAHDDLAFLVGFEPVDTPYQGGFT
jgi:hypothetical protein